MKDETNDKVLAIYRAVWEILDEGQDISKVKVADITARAGIGKGTAYEYFRSKEEIMEKALQYEFRLQYQLLVKRLHEQNSFRQAVESCFDWLEENRDKQLFAIQLLRKRGCSLRGKKPEQDFELLRKEAVDQVLGYMVRLGREEGIISERIPDRLAVLQIFSQLFGFFVYQKMKKNENIAEIQKTKQFLCDSIEKSLRQ